MMGLNYAGQLGGTTRYIVQPATMRKAPSQATLTGTPAKNRETGRKMNPQIAAVSKDHAGSGHVDKEMHMGKGHGKDAKVAAKQMGSGKAKRHRPLSRQMERRLAEHAKDHSAEHIQMMKADIQSGMTFKRAHTRAMAAVGK